MSPAEQMDYNGQERAFQRAELQEKRRISKKESH